ncbi:FHA domain-containing protein [Alloscardovia omnicolens]|uniref:FHA domain-containing protein FhaB/FipA n=1 Tax=Alloscardovia omnicolens TaxID=419015 RepID=UPI003A7075B4
MTDLTFAILKYGFLIGLWLFVWLTVRAINRDVVSLAPHRSKRHPHRERDKHMVAVGSDGPVVVPVEQAQNTSDEFAVQPATSAPAVLTIIDGPLSGTTMPLGTGSISLGRAADNNIVIDDEFVSSHHARVFLDVNSGQWAVEDLDSTNGTKVADQSIHNVCLLPSGVPVRIGATTFELR